MTYSVQIWHGNPCNGAVGFQEVTQGDGETSAPKFFGVFHYAHRASKRLNLTLLTALFNGMDAPTKVELLWLQLCLDVLPAATSDSYGCQWELNPGSLVSLQSNQIIDQMTEAVDENKVVCSRSINQSI